MSASTGNAILLLPQYKRLDNDKRYTIVTGGRGSGKSFHVAVWCLVQTYQRDQVILYTRYTLVSAHDSIIPEFVDKIELLGLEGVFYVTKTKIINKYTGSYIIFRGIKTSSGNQTAKLKSIAGLTCWILDEAEELPNKMIFDKIDDSIRTKGATNKVMLVLNPTDKQHWIYKNFFRSKKKSVEYIHTTYLDNESNLDKSFIAKAENAKVNNPTFYANNYLGKWGNVQDLVFPKGYTTYSDEEEPTEELDKVVYGGDFGYTHDPSVLVRTHVVGNKLYLREIFRQTGLDPVALAEKIVKLGLQEAIQVWDSSDKGSISVLKRNGIRAFGAKKGAYSVYPQLEYLQRFEVFIHEDSKLLQAEWERYKWSKDESNEYVRNNKGHLIPLEDEEKEIKDHGIDAVRYARTRFARWDS